MPNPRLVQDDYVQTASFTLRAKDLKYLDKIAKKYKNRSEALRAILDEAQAIEPFAPPYAFNGGNCPPRKRK